MEVSTQKDDAAGACGYWQKGFHRLICLSYLLLLTDRCTRAGCNVTLSVMHGSLLQDCNYAHIFLPLAYAFVNGKGTVATAKKYHCSTDTVTKVFDMFRAAAAYVVTGPLHPACRPGEHHFKMGGPGWVVEIDEAKFCKRKYGRGRVGSAQSKGWVLGAVVRNTYSRRVVNGQLRRFYKKGLNGQMMLRAIFHERRSAATIRAFVQKYLRPGTLIMTDEARAYRPLRNHGYAVCQVNHSSGEFVRRGPGIPGHRPFGIQGKEGNWKWVRHEAIPVCGVKGGDKKYKLRFAAFIYKRLLKTNRKWKDKDPVKLLLQHTAAWHQAGQPDATPQM